MQELYNTKVERNNAPIHYYGDIVRGCFIMAGCILLAIVLIDRRFLEFYLVLGTLGVLIMVILAGLTSPRTFWVLVSEAIIAGFGFITFEYLAVVAYIHTESLIDPIFLLRQLLSVLFLVTLYYSVKSIRWHTTTANE